MAINAELVDQTNRLLFTINAKKGATAPQPIFIPRPGPKPEKRNATPEELAVILGEQGVMIRGEKRKD